MKNNIENILLMCSEQSVSLSLSDGALEVLFDDTPCDDLIALLRENKSQIVSYLSEYQQQSNLTPIKKLAEQSAPLSFGQKRLWFIDKLENGSAHYNMPLALELRGKLDIDALYQSLNAIVERHEVLRTSYEVGGSRQVVNNEFKLMFNHSDICQKQDKTQKLQDLIEQEQMREFDLSNSLMIRYHLIQFEESAYLLLVTLHHIACDGWSLGILVNELVELYTAFVQQRPQQLAELPVQYCDYAFWQDSNRDAFEQQLGFWTQHLAQAPSLHGLHLDHSRPAYQSFEGDNVSSKLCSGQTAAIHTLCKELDVTPFMFCYSVFALLIARLSDEQDVVIGTAMANRNNASIESLIGYFANTLALRSHIDGKQPFSDFVAQNKIMLLEVFSHQDVPFEMVVDRIQPERNLAHSPLFQIMFSFHSQAKGKLVLPELQLIDTTPKAKTVKTDLELAISEESDGFVLDWNFSTALFERHSIERISACFENLLTAVLGSPNQNLSKYSIITNNDLIQLKEWRGITKENITNDDIKTIHGMFEQIVLQQPDAVAVVSGDVSITYEKLDEKANQLAHYLLSKNVSAKQIVGVKIPRTEQLLIALMGVLKAGACYLPLEASYPQARLDYMLENSGAELVLTESIMMDILGGGYSSSKEGLPRVDAQQLAYIIYTSGSTGKPKGVMVSHQNVTHFIGAMSPYLKEKGVWLAVTGIAFDISVLELFGTLTHGFKLVLYSDNSGTYSSLAELISQHSVTHLQCTPSFAAMYLSDGEILSKLRHFFVGGETLPQALAEQLLTYPELQAHNMYGPTEATVWASMKTLSKSNPDVSIGKPLHNYEIRILDRYLNEQPVGVPGELYIGGEGVTKGYMANPQLTSEKFIISPFRDGVVIYRTGDKACWNEYGELEFLGRIDSQIKLRGHRIEPDEINGQILSVTDIENSVVILDKAKAGDRLVAYLQPDEWPKNQDVLVAKVKDYLAKMLPAYMIPTAYMVLEALPLTLNGKINRAALPSLEFESSLGEYLAPSTGIERTLVSIWAELLVMEVDDISCNVSFFDLGGHSLLLTKMLGELKKRFQVEFTIREIFEHATIYALASMIEERSLSEVDDIGLEQATTVAENQTEELVL